MAQVFVPDNSREREQLQASTTTTTEKITYSPTHDERRTKRRFGGIDLLILLSLLAVIAFLTSAAARWTAPLIAGYSLLRIVLGYILSLIFTLLYGTFSPTTA